MANQLAQALERERMKTNAAGVAGAFIGFGAGEYAGNLVGKTASSTANTQHAISIATKLVLGLLTLFLNSMTGLAGVFLVGLSWGFLGSTVTDVALLANQGGLVGMAQASAKILGATARLARGAGVTIHSAETVAVADARAGPQGGNQLVAIAE